MGKGRKGYGWSRRKRSTKTQNKGGKKPANEEQELREREKDMPEKDMSEKDMPEEDMPEEDMPEKDMPEKDMLLLGTAAGEKASRRSRENTTSDEEPASKKKKQLPPPALTVDEDSQEGEYDEESPSEAYRRISDRIPEYFTEGLQELQRLHGHEKNVHFYEYVMAMVFGARLDKATTLQEFAKFITSPSLIRTTENFDLTLDLCERKMRGTTMLQQNKQNKVLVLYLVLDDTVELKVFEKKNASRKELCFLSWARNRVRYGDLSGVPLLLNDVNIDSRKNKKDDPQISIFTPDYGLTLCNFMKNSSSIYDKNIVCLSLLSTLCSIPSINRDLHDHNICVYRPEIVFINKWTIRVANFLFEFSWKSNGMLATIDWENHELFPRLNSFVSSCSSFFSPVLWETKIGNFEEYGLKLQGHFSGLYGMEVILNYVLFNFDTSLFKLKFRDLPEYRKVTNVSSLLEAFPADNPETYCVDDVVKARWNQCVSSQGRNFKSKKFLTPDDIKSIRGMYSKFTDHIERPFYDIPSDLGKVLLMKDGKLVAAKSIKPDEIITYVPLTKCETFSNPRVWVGSVQGTVIKKAWPFCGFGGFTQWGSKAKSNCMMQTTGSFVALFATKSISFEEQIVCEKKWEERSKDDINQDVNWIKSFVKNLSETLPKTRSDIPPEESSVDAEEEN